MSTLSWLTTFHGLKDLPPEIRTYVWQLCLPDPHPFVFYSDYFDILGEPLPHIESAVLFLAPATLYINRESRHVTKQWCKRHSFELSYDRKIGEIVLSRSFNAHEDILWLAKLDLLEVLNEERRSEPYTDMYNGAKHQLLESRHLAIPAASSLEQPEHLAKKLSCYARLETVWLMWAPEGRALWDRSLMKWEPSSRKRGGFYRGARYTARPIESSVALGEYMESAQLMNSHDLPPGHDAFLSHLQLNPGKPRTAVKHLQHLAPGSIKDLANYRWISAEFCDAGDLTEIMRR